MAFKSRVLAGIVVLGFGAALFAPRAAVAQGSGQLDGKQLKEMLKGLGHVLKELNTEPGKEKFEFVEGREGFDVPVAAEVSPSKRYIWLTVYLGDTKNVKGFSTKGEEFLKRNSDIQPAQFYVTKSTNRLMMGLAMENRNLDAPTMRRSIDKIVDDVVAAKDLWASD